MRLYVANATQHVYNFLYTPAEAKSYRSQTIPIGSQVRLSDDLTSDDLDLILNHHKVYGLIAVDEIANAREFKGICYSIDKPIPAGKIEALMRHNTNELVELGKKIRADAAVASNVQLENDIVESARPDRLKNFDMSIVEENHDERDETPAVAEGFRRNYDDPREPDRAPAQNRNQRRRR